MKTKLNLIAIVIACFFCVSLNAQTNEIVKNTYPQRIDLLSPPANNTFSPGNYYAKEKSIEHWRKLKTAGIITTGVGVASFAGGIALAASVANEPGYDKDNLTQGQENKLAWAGGGILGSIPAVLGGVTMWVIGGVNNAKMKKQGLGFSNTKNGFGLVYKF